MNMLNSTAEILGAVVVEGLDLVLDNKLLSILWTGLIALPGAWVLGQVFY